MRFHPGLVFAIALLPAAARAGCPASATSAAFASDGRYPVGQRTLALVDPSRATAAYKSTPGATSRTLTTEVWYPAAAGATPPAIARGGPFPLVINSPGLGDNRRGEEYYARSLASRGYVVASIDFP